MSHEAPRSDSAPPAGPPRLARAVAAVGCLAWGWLLAITLAGALGFDVRRHHLEAAGLTFGAALVLLALARARELGPSRAWDSAGRAVPLAAAVAAALPVLWSLDLGLLSDDFGLRAWARAGTLLPDGWPFVRPLPLMIWRGIDAVTASPVALHLFNVALHTLNAALVAVLGAWLFGRASGLAAGLLFAVMPVTREAIVWASGVFDLLATSGVLIAVVGWWWMASTRSPQDPSGLRSHSSYAGAVLVWAGLTLGVASKETAFVLPALLTLLEIVAPPAPRARRRTLMLAAVWAVVLLLMLVRMLFGQLSSGSVPLPSGRFELKVLLAAPFMRLAAPFRVDDGVPLVAWIGGLIVLIALGGLLLTVVRSGWRRAAAGSPLPGVDSGPALAALAMALAWPLITAAPLGLAFYVAPNLEGGRYLYLPSAGFALALGAAVGQSGRLRPLMIGALAVLMLLWGEAAVAERQHWNAAATLRDAVLRQASTFAAKYACRKLELHNAPDNVRGAYVFRSGLPEALDVVVSETGTARCVGEWTGRTIARVR